MNNIQSILDKHEPALEMKVRQYIESVVESAIEEGSDENVGQILSSFLSEEESFDIILTIHVQEIAHGIESTSIKSNDTPPQLSEDLRTLTLAPETSFLPLMVDDFQKLHSSEPNEASWSKSPSKSHRKALILEENGFSF